MKLKAIAKKFSIGAVVRFERVYQRRYEGMPDYERGHGQREPSAYVPKVGVVVGARCKRAGRITRHNYDDDSQFTFHAKGPVVYVLLVTPAYARKPLEVIPESAEIFDGEFVLHPYVTQGERDATSKCMKDDYRGGEGFCRNPDNGRWEQ